MTENVDTLAASLQEPDTQRLEVRSVTGACYTLVQEADGDGPGDGVHRHYRTAWARLPVIANDDGSFTIVDTHTRLVRVDPL